MTHTSESIESATQVMVADPRANYLAHRGEIDEALHRVLDKGRYILGEEVDTFEREFARYIGARWAIGVGNGTDAVELALRACGIGPGDLVATVSHTAVATVCAICSTGARPVLLDISKGDFTMDLNRLEDLLKHDAQRRVKAVVPVHLYGQPVDIVELKSIVGPHGAFVVEDCAQAHGAEVREQKVGSLGDVGAFSFYPTKNLGALGDGGAIVTSDPGIAEKVRLLRQYGWKERYVSEIPGTNTRLDELQAAVLRVKLRFLDSDNGRRRAIAGRYDRELRGTPVIVPVGRSGMTHVYHQYVIRSADRDMRRAALKDSRVDTAILYPVPVHLQAAYASLVDIGPGGLPITTAACKEILSLPMYPELRDIDVSRVTSVLRASAAKGKPALL